MAEEGDGVVTSGVGGESEGGLGVSQVRWFKGDLDDYFSTTGCNRLLDMEV